MFLRGFTFVKNGVAGQKTSQPIDMNFSLLPHAVPRVAIKQPSKARNGVISRAYGFRKLCTLTSKSSTAL